MKIAFVRALIISKALFLVSCCFSQQLIPWEDIHDINNRILAQSPTTKTDGPIEVEKWFDSNSREYPSDYRIMFVLKEAYGNDTICRDLTEYRRNPNENSIMDMDAKEGRPTYRPMVTIANMLVNEMHYYEIDPTTRDAYTLFKECSAIVEIKKEYGKSQSDDNIIKDHARKNKSIIYKQVEIYNPNVVILCLNNLLDGIFVNQEVGGYEVLGDQVPGANIKTIRVNGKEFYCYYNDKRIFINAYHPSWWYLNKEEYCDEIVRVINEWIEEREDE